ncbi:tetratricopeptide repeat protein [Treponema medium]|uniref:tetratricopeptide repeat protein n=1 Tax=Treponema medium TaxID=58231 RepID=UPI0019820BDA|nr:tetratricopeptide repeat protein [Treponema medium]QSH91701.1 tetratricopeptide repeat protein [Treponema medium]
MSESLDFIFERANSALITQDFEYAERLLTNVLKKHPDILPSDKEKIENLLARIYGDEGNLEQSLAAYLRLYESAPDNIELMLSLGRIYRHLERYEDALHILEKAQASGGDTDEVLYSFAKTYKKMGDYAKAAEYFSRAIEVKPDHAHAYDRLGNLYVLTGETDKAIEIYKQGLRVDANHPYLNFHLAGLLRQEKRYEEAIVYYNSALRVNPAWGEVLAGIAATYLELDQLDDALNTYRSLLRVSGENAPLYTELGALFEKKQLQQEAEQYYYDALAIDSGYAPAALALTNLLEKKQRYNEALPILLAAEAAPVNADNHVLRLKAIQMRMYAKDYAKAHELFGRLDTEHGNSLNALKLRGQLYALTGEVEQAEETFKQILKTVPSAIEFRLELAEQYLLAHKYEEAKEQLKLFLRQKPNDISALMALGRTEELLNNPQAAYQEYQKVLELKPNAIEAHSALSRLFQKRGDTLEALKTANEILNMQSGAESDEPEQDMAASLDLYEQAAENYIADPLLTKNLEQLKSDDSHLYISPAELNPEPKQNIPSLRDISMSERELPFEMLIEGTEEVKELPPEKDDVSISGIQLNGTQQSDISAQSAFPSYSGSVSAPHTFGAGNSDTAGFTAAGNSAGGVPQTRNNLPNAQVGAAANETFASPVDELYLNPDHFENNTAFGVGSVSQKNVQALHKRQELLRDEVIQDRLKELDTYGTTIGFLQDVISDIDKQLDENQYAQAVEVLAERIAENLSRKMPLQSTVVEKESEEQPVQSEQQVLQESVEISQEATTESTIEEESEAVTAAGEAEVVAEEDTERAVATTEEAEDTAVAAAEEEEENTAAAAEKESENTPAEDEAVAVTEEEEGLQIAETQEAFPDTEEDRVPVDKDVSVNDDSVHVIETAEEDIFGTEENQAISLETETVPIDEIMKQDHAEAVTEEVMEEEPVDVQSDFNQEEGAEITVDTDEDAASEDLESEEEYEPSNNEAPFVLDQEQQNLLWCHAKHQIKDSPSFEQYLNTTDPEQLAQLFLYLRDLVIYLPQEELEIFLNSSERIQIYYIIARLSGELGLKERANLINETCSVVSDQQPYNDAAVFKLLSYLRDLSIELPDQELGTRVRQELEQLIANMSAVLPDLS